MNAIQRVGQFVLAAAVLGFVLGGTRVQGEDPPEKKSAAERKPGNNPDKTQKEVAKAPKGPVLHLKVFRLNRADPESARQILDVLLEEPAAIVTAPPTPLANPAIGQGMLGNPAGGMFGMAGLGMGGGLGGLGALGGPLQPEPTSRLAVDSRTGALLVRGTDADVRLTAEVVAVLETPGGKPLPKVSRLRAYRLRFAQAQDLVEIFGNLELDARIAADPTSNTLFAAGAEERLQELDEAIKVLDVRSKKPEKPEGAGT